MAWNVQFNQPKVRKNCWKHTKKTMHMIQNVKGQFEFPDLEAERKSMYTDGLNNPDYEL
jgi:hypothetical protein